MKINKKKISAMIEKGKQWMQKQKTIKALREEEDITGREQALKWSERKANVMAREAAVRQRMESARPRNSGGGGIGSRFAAMGERMGAIGNAMDFDFGMGGQRPVRQKKTKKGRKYRRRVDPMFDFSDVL